MTQKKSKVAVITTLTFAVFAVHVVFGALAGIGVTPKLFPSTVGNVSNTFKLFLTPTDATFSIWGVIYFLQFAWIIYTMVGSCGNESARNILSTRFFACFMLSTAFVTGWLFSWSRSEIVPSFIVIVFHQIFVELAFAVSCFDLHDYLNTHEVTSENKSDIWCQRILVQNGLLFYLTWTAIATLLNFSILLNQELNVTDETSSLIALIILAVATLAWFFLESFTFKSYTEYTVSAYVTLIWALSGTLSRVWGENDVISGVAIGLLVISVILLVLRIVLIVLRSRKRAEYSNISYNAAAGTVTS